MAGGRRGTLQHGVFFFFFSSKDYSRIETYFSTPPLTIEGGIKVLLWRGGVNAEGRMLKEGEALILAGVSSKGL